MPFTKGFFFALFGRPHAERVMNLLSAEKYSAESKFIFTTALQAKNFFNAGNVQLCQDDDAP